MSKQYIFLPWLRRGLASQIAEPDPLKDSPAIASRAGVKLNVGILADDIQKASVQQEVVLVGHGDIVGIDKSAIVKTDPAPGTKNFQPNFFPYIEFYEEDFPWRYTPGKAAGEKRLRPWLALVVLQETEFQRMRLQDDRGTVKIRIESEAVHKALPNLEQSWAWTHVQIIEGTITAEDLADTNNRNQLISGVLSSNPNLGVSRIMCPRKLDAKTKYFAFVVPAFEKGRLAGLGAELSKIEAVSRFKSSWSADSEVVELPVYHEWSFSTGEEDFEALAEKITPLDLSGTEVGRIWMDASDINYGNTFDYSGNLQPELPDRKGSLPFEGALVLPVDPSQPPSPGVVPSMPLTMRSGQPEKDFLKRFAGLVNLGVQYRMKQVSELQWAAEIPGNDVDDLLLVPPIYGRWYANAEGAATVDSAKTTHWLEQMNLDPAFRVAAGLGAEIVRTNQEEFVSRAWAQLTDKRKILNNELKRLRFAQEVTNATYKKRFNPVASGQATHANQLLALTQSFHSMVVSDDPALSVAGQLNGYKPDTVFVQPTYRRITRSNGPIIKRTHPVAVTHIAMTAFAHPFFMEAFFINPAPPFQNFNNNEKLAKLNTNLFVSIFFNDPTLQIPGWFGRVPGGITIRRGLFPSLVKQLQETALRKPLVIKPAPVSLQALTAKVNAKILPANSFRNRYKASIPTVAPALVSESDKISPNSFNPFYTDPTYELLGKAEPELFIPNLDLINPDSFVLLQANSAFIEAYLVGMNHELASEFLWRGYPADMNATFFRQFWDKSDSPPSSQDKSEIEYIRKWNQAHGLGKNGPPGSIANPLVFVIKAELVKNYPNLVVYAQKGKMINNQHRVPDMDKAPMLPIFLSALSPDYLFAGFALTKPMVLGNPVDPTPDGGYYFVIAERPGEMHFGLDQPGDDDNTTWNDLSWTKLPSVAGHIDLQKDIPPNPSDPGGLVWGKGESPVTALPTGGTGDSAQMAAILNQKPVRIFVHASQLVS